MRGATLTEDDWRAFAEFQSTRPVRGATLRADNVADGEDISIHAPRAGRDLRNKKRPRRGRYFNPRAPCGARPDGTSIDFITTEFQSTRPVRGATQRIEVEQRADVFQSMRPVRGATRL